MALRQTQMKKQKKLRKIKLIPIEFRYQKYKKGENQVNEALDKGYSYIDDFRTESGLVVVMGSYDSKSRIKPDFNG